MEKMLNDLVQFLIKHTDFIFGMVINIIVIYLFCRITDTFTSKFENRLRTKNPESPLLNLMPVLTRIFKAIVIFLLLAGFLQSFGYNVTSLVAGFGITGLAVGFAAKEAIGNVFGSIGLLADKVYKVGEYISFNGYEGTVEDVNLRSTTIRTLDGFRVNVPNNVLANEEITNISQANKRRIDLTIDIEYGTPNEKIDRAIEILKEIVKDNPRMYEDPLVFLENLASSSIQVRLFSYAKTTKWAEFVIIKGEVIKEIIHRYREEGIEFAFPSTSIYMAKNEN